MSTTGPASYAGTKIGSRSGKKAVAPRLPWVTTTSALSAASDVAVAQRVLEAYVGDEHVRAVLEEGGPELVGLAVPVVEVHPDRPSRVGQQRQHPARVVGEADEQQIGTSAELRQLLDGDVRIGRGVVEEDAHPVTAADP